MGSSVMAYATDSGAPCDAQVQNDAKMDVYATQNAPRPRCDDAGVNDAHLNPPDKEPRGAEVQRHKPFTASLPHPKFRTKSLTLCEKETAQALFDPDLIDWGSEDEDDGQVSFPEPVPPHNVECEVKAAAQDINGHPPAWADLHPGVQWLVIKNLCERQQFPEVITNLGLSRVQVQDFLVHYIEQHQVWTSQEYQITKESSHNLIRMAREQDVALVDMIRRHRPNVSVDYLPAEAVGKGVQFLEPRRLGAEAEALSQSAGRKVGFLCLPVESEILNDAMDQSRLRGAIAKGWITSSEIRRLLQQGRARPDETVVVFGDLLQSSGRPGSSGNMASCSVGSHSDARIAESSQVRSLIAPTRQELDEVRSSLRRQYPQLLPRFVCGSLVTTLVEQHRPPHPATDRNSQHSAALSLNTGMTTAQAPSETPRAEHALPTGAANAPSENLTQLGGNCALPARSTSAEIAIPEPQQQSGPASLAAMPPPSLPLRQSANSHAIYQAANGIHNADYQVVMSTQGTPCAVPGEPRKDLAHPAQELGSKASTPNLAPGAATPTASEALRTYVDTQFSVYLPPGQKIPSGINSLKRKKSQASNASDSDEEMAAVNEPLGLPDRADEDDDDDYVPGKKGGDKKKRTPKKRHSGGSTGGSDKKTALQKGQGHQQAAQQTPVKKSPSCRKQPGPHVSTRQSETLFGLQRTHPLKSSEGRVQKAYYAWSADRAVFAGVSVRAQYARTADRIVTPNQPPAGLEQAAEHFGPLAKEFGRVEENAKADVASDAAKAQFAGCADVAKYALEAEEAYYAEVVLEKH